MRATAQTISDYDELILALRERANEMDMTREEMDSISGLQDGYSGKLLSLNNLTTAFNARDRSKARGFGRTSLGPTLQTLGCRLMLIEDTAQTAKILARRKPRERPVREPKGEPGTIEHDLERIDDLARIVLDGPDG